MRRGMMTMRLLLVLAFAASGVAAQSPGTSTPAPGTVSWYLQNPDDPNGRKAVLARCEDDPGHLAQTPNCINAKQAEAQAFLAPSAVPLTGYKQW